MNLAKMAPTCSNFVIKTFAHVAGLIGLTAVGTQLPYMDALITKSQESFLGKVLYVGILMGVFMYMLFLSPGIPKYVLAALIAAFFGMILRADISRLVDKDALKRVLVTTVAICIGMMALAAVDTSGRFLSFYPVLGMGLLTLVITQVFFYFTEKRVPKWIESLGAGLFALFIAADTQMIRKHARECRKNPDYIGESYGLFLDLLNLFSFVGGSD